MTFVQVGLADIELGQPLKWDVYDRDHRMVVSRGVALVAERQLGLLQECGPLRKAVPGEAQTAPSEAQIVDSEIRPAIPLAEETEAALHDIRLEIGATAQLHLGGDRYYVKLIGYLQGEAVLVSYPRVGGALLPLAEGSPLVVRLFSGQCAYAFLSHICRLAMTPCPLLYLEYPGKVRGVRIRQGARAPVKLAVTVQDGEGQTHQAVIANLSAGGASLLAKQVVGVWGERVGLEFSLPLGQSEERLRLHGLIRVVGAGSSGEGDAASRVRHGVQFVDVPHVEKVALAAYVYQRLFEEGPAV